MPRRPGAIGVEIGWPSTVLDAGERANYMQTTSMPPAYPSRFVNLDAARARFGDRVDRLAPYLAATDPLADAAVAALDATPRAAIATIERALAGAVDVPAPLRELIAVAEMVPPWLDWAAIERGGRVLLRAGVLGGIVLGAKSLVYGYASPAGNKPLVLSGRLTEQAARRLNETARFVQAVVRHDGLRRHGDGFTATVKVRLMHAQVRYFILRSESWKMEAWGLPINQHDMMATTLLFSLVVLQGLRQLGALIDRDESDDYMHLWRYVAHVIGVDPMLVPATEREAEELAALIAATQAPPDEDSRNLVSALMTAGESSPDAEERARARRYRPVAQGICRALVGDTLADGVGLPRSPWVHALLAIRTTMAAIESARRRASRIERAMVRAGTRYWDDVVQRGLTGATTEFALPQRLEGLRQTA